MLKKTLYLSLFLFLFLSVAKAYAGTAPSSTLNFTGSLTASATDGTNMFNIDGSNNTLTGQGGGSSGTITYTPGASGATGSFGGSISLGASGEYGTLTGSSNTITYSAPTSGGQATGSGTLTYSKGNLTGSITINAIETLTVSPTTENGILICPPNGPNGGYGLQNGVCVDTVTTTFTISVTENIIGISGGNSSGTISINTDLQCPTGEVPDASGTSCIGSPLLGTSSTFWCLNAANNQNIACLSESQNTAIQSTYGIFESVLLNAAEQQGANNWWTQTVYTINWSKPVVSGSNVIISVPPLGGSFSVPLAQFASAASSGTTIGITDSMADSAIQNLISGYGIGNPWGFLIFPNAESTTPNELCPLQDEQCVTMTQAPSCPSGYTLNSSNECVYNNEITVSPSCPFGWTLSKGICSYTTNQYTPTTSGYSLVSSSPDYCSETINQTPCSTGYTLNTSTGQCSQTATIPAKCPSGFTGPNSSGVCTQTLTTPATCPKGYKISGYECVTKATSVPAACPSGYSPDTASPGECIEISTLAPTCPNSNYVLDPTTGMCNLTQYKVPLYEIVASDSTDGQSCTSTLTQVETCPGTGYTIDSATGLCVNSSGNTEKPNPCPTGYIPSFGECLGVTAATTGFTPSSSTSGSPCPFGYTYNGTTCTASPTPNTTTTATGSCPKNYTGPNSSGECTATGTAVTTTVYTCPNGSTVASSTDACTATASCPAKYTLSGGACTASPACPANYTGPNSSGECSAGSPTTTTTTSSASCPYGYSWNGVNCSDTVNNTYYASLDATFSGDIYNTSDNTLQFYGSGDNIEIGSTPGWGGNIYYSSGNFYGSWYSTVTGATAVDGFGSSLVGEGSFTGSSINFSGGSFSGNIGSILSGSGDQIVGAGSIHSGSITASTYCPSGYYYIGGNECEENSSYTYTTSPTCSSGTYIGDYTCSETVYTCPNGTTVSSSTSTCTASATCPNGSTATSNTCTASPRCPTDYTFNSTNDNCTASPTATTGTVYDCPDGSTSSTSTCTASVSTGSTTTTYTCPNGSSAPSASYICTVTPTSSTNSSATCPTGTTANSSGDCVYTLNASVGSGDSAGTPSAGNQCLYPVCPSGYTFNTTTQMCIDQTSVSSCQVGYLYGSQNCTGSGDTITCTSNGTPGSWFGSITYNPSSNSFSGTIYNNYPVANNPLYKGSGNTIIGAGGASDSTGTITFNSSTGAFSGFVSNGILSYGANTLTGSGNTLSEAVPGYLNIEYSNGQFQSTSNNGLCSETLTASACPVGYTYNASNNTCSGQETTSLICPTTGTNSSYTLSGLTCTEKLTQNTCPSGYTFDSSNNTCTETTTESACPNGTLSGGTCTETQTATPICSNSDYYFNGSTNSCQPYTQGANCPNGYGGPYYDGSGYDCTVSPTTNTSTNPVTYDCPNGSTVPSSTSTCTASPICTTSGYAYNSSQNMCYPTASVSITCPGATTPSAGSSTQTESACPTGYNYVPATNLCQNISDMSACPANWELINGVCVSNACPYGSPMYQAPGQANMCSQTSSGSPYYCSPEDCYNNAVNTPKTTLETLPSPETNNGTVTKKGCSGTIYIFPGQAMQCTRYLVGNCCSHSKFMFGSRQCSSQDQTVSQDIIYDNQYSPPVPIYTGSGGLNASPITSCSNSAIKNNACGQLGDTIYIGSYCSGHLIGNIGPCMSTSYVVCAFQGLLATIIQAQGRAQLSGGPDAISWGSAQSPNCTGFTPTQFQELNFSNMNLTEYIDVIKNQALKSLNTAKITAQIKNTTTSIGNEVQMIETGTTP